MPMIKCENASFSYEGRTVSENISFELKGGDYICVVGKNGSGKSTLIKGLVGLKAPMNGKIELCGIKREEIGYLPQQRELQRDFPASVMEIVLSGTRALFYGKKEKALAIEKMRLLEIDGFAGRSFSDLSGGQQQRVLLARALCSAKRLLVLDEPSAGLDPLVTEHMYKLLKSENEQSGLSVVMVSHDVKSAIENAKTILHLEHSLQFFGAAQEYAKSELAAELIGR